MRTSATFIRLTQAALDDAHSCARIRAEFSRRVQTPNRWEIERAHRTRERERDVSEVTTKIFFRGQRNRRVRESDKRSREHIHRIRDLAIGRLRSRCSTGIDPSDVVER